MISHRPPLGAGGGEHIWLPCWAHLAASRTLTKCGMDFPKKSRFSREAGCVCPDSRGARALRARAHSAKPLPLSFPFSFLCLISPGQPIRYSPNHLHAPADSFYRLLSTRSHGGRRVCSLGLEDVDSKRGYGGGAPANGSDLFSMAVWPDLKRPPHPHPSH